MFADIGVQGGKKRDAGGKFQVSLFIRCSCGISVHRWSMRDRDLAPVEATLHIWWSPGKNEKIIMERLRLGGSSGEPELLLAADLTSALHQLTQGRFHPEFCHFEQVHHFASSISSVRLVCF